MGRDSASLLLIFNPLFSSKKIFSKSWHILFLIYNITVNVVIVIQRHSILTRKIQIFDSVSPRSFFEEKKADLIVRFVLMMKNGFYNTTIYSLKRQNDTPQKVNWMRGIMESTRCICYRRLYAYLRISFWCARKQNFWARESNKTQCPCNPSWPDWEQCRLWSKTSME